MADRGADFRSLRVAIVVPSYRTPYGGNGGVAGVTDFLAGELAELGEVEIVSLCMSRLAPQSRSILRPSSWVAGARATTRAREAGKPPVTDVGAPLAELEWARFLPRRALCRVLSHVDVIVVVSGSPAAAFAVRGCGKPVVLQVATMARLERGRLLREPGRGRRAYRRVAAAGTELLDRRGLGVADVVCVENLHMEWLSKQLGAVCVELCPPGVDTERFASGAGPRDRGHVVAVGRLGDPRKDFGALLQAFASARTRTRQPLFLTIAGRGPARAEDLAAMERLGLTCCARFLSDVADTELVKLLGTAGVFVSSSAEEGLGLSIVEAMAAGLPVVSTRTDGATFALGDPPVGLLANVGDHEALAQGIVRLCEDPTAADELARGGQRRARETFGLRPTGEFFREVVKKAVAG